MKQDIKIGVIGGDMRQLVTARELAEEGYDVTCFGLAKKEGMYAGITKCRCLDECVSGRTAILLGVPYSNDGKWINCPPEDCAVSVKALFEVATPGQIILGGRFNSSVYAMAEHYGLKLIDYIECEEFSVLNAIPTAEGALEIAMRELDVTIHGSKALVLGFGRCGKAVARALAALGANVTCGARKKSDLAWMDVYGYTSCNIQEFKKEAMDADVIFNTVPEFMLTREILSKIPRNTLIIDLASGSGGVDMEAAKELGCRVIRALSLPGKVAPVSAGRIIKNTVINILEGEGIL